MRGVFGRLKQGVLEVEGHKVVVEDVGEGLLRYARESPGGEAVEKMLPHGTVLGLYPLKPIYYPEPLFTRHIYFRFKRSLIVPAGARINVSLKMPVDLGVLVASRRRGEWELLDAFPSSRVKYALYGSPEAGIIARHVEAPVEPGVLGTPEGSMEAVIPLSIENTHKEMVEVSRLVASARLFDLYYTRDDKVYGSGLYMEVLDPLRAQVSAGKDLSIIHGASKSTEPGIFYRMLGLEILRGPKKFLMEWGV
jgi:hypothetical protein